MFDPASHGWRDLTILAGRDQCGPGAAKRPDLVDVVFSSGIEVADGVTSLYAGTSDAEAHWVEIACRFDVPFARATGATDVSTLIVPEHRLQA